MLTVLLLVAAGAAFMMLARPAPPAPSRFGVGATPRPTAPPPGRSGFPWTTAIVVAGGLWAAQAAGLFDRQPPRPPAGPDLVSAFRENDDPEEARHHARCLATILKSLADVLEYDGSRKEPRIRTATQADDLRIALREFRMQGFSFASKYPAVRDVVDQHFTAAVGTSGGPLDQVRRAQWIEASRQLARSAEYAAEEL